MNDTKFTANQVLEHARQGLQARLPLQAEGYKFATDDLLNILLTAAPRQCTIESAAVVAWFGPTDFLRMDEQLAERGLAPDPGTEHNGDNSPESLLLGEQITKIPELVKAANPETYITSDAPPFFLQHGTMDGTVPVQPSIAFATKLEQVLGRDMIQLGLLEGAEHGDPRFEAPDNVKKVLGFLDKHLK